MIGVVAGDLECVAKALQIVEEKGAELGLKLKVGKCKLILPAEAASHNLTTLFPPRLLTNPETGASRVLTKGNFELLGAAIGDDTFCEKYMAERVAQCDKLLGEPKAFDDPQVALRLLRACAGVCKVMHSMRMAPRSSTLTPSQTSMAESLKPSATSLGPCPITSSGNKPLAG